MQCVESNCPYYDLLYSLSYRAFSHDVTAAMLVYQNKETVTILMYQANPLGIEMYFYANTFFCFTRTCKNTSEFPTPETMRRLVLASDYGRFW